MGAKIYVPAGALFGSHTSRRKGSPRRFTASRNGLIALPGGPKAKGYDLTGLPGHYRAELIKTNVVLGGPLRH